MNPGSDSAIQVAQRVCERAGITSGSAEEIGAATERLCGQLRTGLGRWIGIEGCRALFDRAFRIARDEHPALVDVGCLDPGDAPAATAPAERGAQCAAGVVAMVAALVDLLGRIIGEEMAAHLVEQVSLPNARRPVKTELLGGRHGEKEFTEANDRATDHAQAAEDGRSGA